MIKLVEAPGNVVAPKTVTTDAIKGLFANISNIELSYEVILEIQRRLEETARVIEYLRLSKSKSKSKADPKSFFFEEIVTSRYRAEKPLRDPSANVGLEPAEAWKLQDLQASKRRERLLAEAEQIWEAHHHRTRLMVKLGDAFVPLEKISPTSTNAKPQVGFIVCVIYGIWKNLLGLPFKPEPSADLKLFATRVFQLLQDKHLEEPAIRTRLKRFSEFAIRMNQPPPSQCSTSGKSS